MYYCHPIRFANLHIPRQYRLNFVSVICNGSPSRMRIVRRISFGITTLPKSSPRVKYSPRVLKILYFTGFLGLFAFFEKGIE